MIMEKGHSTASEGARRCGTVPLKDTLWKKVLLGDAVLDNSQLNQLSHVARFSPVSLHAIHVVPLHRKEIFLRNVHRGASDGTVRRVVGRAVASPVPVPCVRLRLGRRESRWWGLRRHGLSGRRT